MIGGLLSSLFSGGGGSGMNAAQDFRTDLKDYLYFQQTKGVDATTKWNTENQLRYWQRAVDLDNTKYQRAVADARAAGLHPLFALGAQGGGAQMQVPGGAPGGGPLPAPTPSAKFVGKGLSATDRRMADLAVRRQEVALQRDHVALMAAQSDLKRAEQAMLNNPGAAAEAVMLPGGAGWDPNPKYTDQQKIEDMYGGFVGEIAGLGRFLGERGESLGSWLAKRKRARDRAIRKAGGRRKYFDQEFTGGS